MTEQEELQYLLANSPKALPDDPSSSGWSTSQIKEKHYKGLVILYNWIKAIRTAYIQTENIVNALNDNSTDKPLSANMGKTLKELIDSNKNLLDADISRIDALLASNDTSLNTIQKIVNFIKNNKSLIDSLSSGKISVSAIVDDLLSTDSSKVLSAKQGKVLKDLLDAEVSNRQTAVANEILARQNADELLQNNINAEIGKLTNGTTIVDKAYKDHNGNNIDSTYVKISNIINALNDTSTNKPLSAAQGKALKDMIDAINTLLASDTTTLDTLQEVVNYIKNNKSLIDGITISKMAFTDLVKNLTTNNDNLPLAASQGYALKAMIDAINDAEDGIQATEALRVIAEAGRVEAEEARQTGYSGFDGRITANTNAIAGIKDGTNLDSFSDVESALATKANTSNVYAKSEVYTQAEAEALINAKCKETADNLRWELGTYDLGVDTNTDTAHIKTLPSGTIQTTVAKVEGVGYKVNQLVKNGDFSDGSTGWNTASIFDFSGGKCVVTNYTPVYTDNGLRQSVPLIANHKYLLLATIKNTTENSETLIIGQAYGARTTFAINGNTTSAFSYIYTITNASTAGEYALVNFGCAVNTTVSFEIDNVMCFDLTADFGSGNEPSTVSDCATAYLPRGINIYEYTPQQSSIKNNAFTGVKVEGFNKWDEETELGSINLVNGTNVSVSNQLRSKNYISVLPNTQYYCKTPAGVWAVFYDSNKTIITGYSTGSETSDNGSKINNTIFTTPNNCAYMRFYLVVGYGTTYQNDICINISNQDLNGTYVPYIAPTTISIDLTTIKDSNNVSLFPSGKLMGNSSVADFITPYNQESRYFEKTLNGTETWQLNGSWGGVNAYQTTISDIVGVENSDTTIRLVSNSNTLQETDTYTIINTSIKFAIAVFSNHRLAIKLDTTSTSSDVNTFLRNNPITIQVERATYLTSNTDLTSLTKINAQSNGTITLNNTDNVDMPNTIKSLKEEVKA